MYHPDKAWREILFAFIFIFDALGISDDALCQLVEQEDMFSDGIDHGQAMPYDDSGFATPAPCNSRCQPGYGKIGTPGNQHICVVLLRKRYTLNIC